MLDNFDFYDQEERRVDALLAKLPTCCICEEPIQDEYGYRIYGDLWCPRCIEDAREYIEED